MKGKIFTAGFEGVTQDWFTMYMGWYGVETVIDVRHSVYERGYHFPMDSLKGVLARRNIGYARLDCAETFAIASFRNAGLTSRAAFASSVRPGSSPSIRVAEAAASGVVCLMGFESDPRHCHRHALAEEAAERTGLDVQHLFPAASTQYCRTVPHIAPEAISF